MKKILVLNAVIACMAIACSDPKLSPTTISITNQSSKTVYFWDTGSLQQFEGGTWTSIRSTKPCEYYECGEPMMVCGMALPAEWSPPSELKPNQTLSIEWDGRIWPLSNINEEEGCITKSIPSAPLRWEFNYGEGYDSSPSTDPIDSTTIYSLTVPTTLSQEFDYGTGEVTLEIVDASPGSEEIDCSTVGCAPPPPCGQECTDPCGCCTNHDCAS